MKSRTRQLLVTVLITSVLSLLIGGFAVFSSFQSDISIIDREIAYVVHEVKINPTNPIDRALVTAETNNYDIAILFLTPDGVPTVLRNSQNISRIKFTPEEFIKAKEGIITVASGNRLRVQVIPLAKGEDLLVAASIHDVDGALKSNQERLLFFILFANFIAALITAAVNRRSSALMERDQLERMQEFLGDAAHELRTPLTVIRGYSELLASKKLVSESEQERAFSRLGHEIARMESLIADLLILAEMGEEVTLEFEEVDFSELVIENLRDFATIAPTYDLATQIEPGLLLHGSQKYLQRFIQNALTNIRQHAPSHAPVCVRLSSSTKWIELVIEDGGPGLPPSSYGEKIRGLKRFDKARSRETGGTGLGMSIMSAVIEKHSGELSLKASDLGGLKISVRLSRSSNFRKLDLHLADENK